mgnify:CR=1 FL=1
MVGGILNVVRRQDEEDLGAVVLLVIVAPFRRGVLRWMATLSRFATNLESAVRRGVTARESEVVPVEV